MSTIETAAPLPAAPAPLHGGARPGAGRKPKPATLPAELLPKTAQVPAPAYATPADFKAASASIAHHPELARFLATLPTDGAEAADTADVARLQAGAHTADLSVSRLRARLTEVRAQKQQFAHDAAAAATVQNRSATDTGALWAALAAESEFLPVHVAVAEEKRVQASLAFLARVIKVAQAIARRAYAEAAPTVAEIVTLNKAIFQSDSRRARQPLLTDEERAVAVEATRLLGETARPAQERAEQALHAANVGRGLVERRLGAALDRPDQWEAVAQGAGERARRDTAVSPR